MSASKLSTIGDFVEPVSSWTPERDDPDGVFTYIDLSAVDQDAKVVSQARELPCSEAPSRARQLVRAGDVLVSTVRPNLNGVALVPPEFEGATASTGYCVLRPRPGQLDGRYLYQWVKSPRFVSDMVRQATGASYPAVSDRIVCESKLPLPPLPEQRRIAEILHKADVLRAKRRAVFAQLDTLTQSTFLDIFGDPATNPMGWKLGRLGEICEVGSSKRVFVEELVTSGVPFYRGTEVGLLGEGLPVEPDLFITKEHFERLKAQSGIPKVGDLLLPSICPDGRIYLVNDDKPFYFKDARVLWVRVDGSRINGVFLKHYLKHLFVTSYSKIASGTTFAELKIVVLKSLSVPAAPLHLQQRFAAIVESIALQSARCRAQQADLETLSSSLQHRAFAGEL